MKKIILFILVALLPFLVKSQTIPAAPGTGHYVIIDTGYNVGPTATGTTTATLYFRNSTTSDKITGMQFRIWYDSLAFNGASPTVSLLYSSANKYMQYVTDTTHGSITITLVYTGSSSTYNLGDSAAFAITFTHNTNTSLFNTLDSIKTLKVSGAQTYTNLASTVYGNDTTLTIYSYGGRFNRPFLHYHGQFVNVTGTNTRNITVSLEKKPKTSGTWVNISTQTTGADGKFNFTTILDTTYWAARLNIEGDTMNIGNIISTADAQKINRFVLGLDNPQAFDFYTSDVNGDHKISISDEYTVYGRIAGRFSTWVNGVKDVLFFTSTEYSTISSNPNTNYTATISGTTNVLFNIVGGSVDSVTYYVVGVGDANGTGFKMAKLTPIQIINPNNNNYIIDETVEYYVNNLNTIEVNLPSLSVDAGNLVNIPVKVLTNGEQIGSLQLALKFDTTLLDFKGVISEEKVGNWMSFINPNSGVVEWGGFDASNNQHLLNNEDQVVTLQFLAKQPKDNWTTSPIYVTRKFAGNALATDLNINPTDGRIEVMRMSSPAINTDNNIASINVYPNPTSGEVVIHFSVPKDGNVTVAFYDVNGKKKYTVIQTTMPKGVYAYKANIDGLAKGAYNVVITTNESSAYNKTILN